MLWLSRAKVSKALDKISIIWYNGDIKKNKEASSLRQNKIFLRRESAPDGIGYIAECHKFILPQ